ncbi:MAG: iron-containing redox enzyme family protein [Bdellovibrionales bacterium]
MFDRIFTAWQDALSSLQGSYWFQKLAAGELELAHYKGYLLETYHHAGLNPQIQAFATMHMKDNPREMISKFFSHAKSEIGHDMMAAQDLINLGVEKELIINSKPLPNTLALNAFVLHLIQFVDPISYLGYLFHLEYLPTQTGRFYIEKLKQMGVQENSLTFLEEHATVDIAHNELMKQYINYFVTNNKTLDNVIYAVQSTCVLHQQMIEAAFVNGEKLFRERAKVKKIK